MSGGARLPVGRMRSTAETLGADWALDRHAYVEVPCGTEGTVVVTRSALRISEADCGPRGGVKHLGADNRAVLTTLLGLCDGEVDALEAGGVLAASTEH